MICDAHVHMGYWRRGDELVYYSPRRIVGVLNRCGVDGFIVSSTSPQAGAIGIADLVREAREVKRVAGVRAHVYCWITGAMFDADPTLRILDSGVYEGIKLHECETSWNIDRKADFVRIIEVAAKKNMNVMLHCGCTRHCSPNDLRWVAEEFSGVKFNFAHCRPINEMLQVMRNCKNVYSDVSCLSIEDIVSACSSDVLDRIMFGSDIPAVCGDGGLTSCYRRIVAEPIVWDFEGVFNGAFAKFTGHK